MSKNHTYSRKGRKRIISLIIENIHARDSRDIRMYVAEIFDDLDKSPNKPNKPKSRPVIRIDLASNPSLGSENTGAPVVVDENKALILDFGDIPRDEAKTLEYNIEGENLEDEPIFIQSEDPFEISTDKNKNFSDTLTIYPEEDGTLKKRKIYVLYNPEKLVEKLSIDVLKNKYITHTHSDTSVNLLVKAKLISPPADSSRITAKIKNPRIENELDTYDIRIRGTKLIQDIKIHIVGVEEKDSIQQIIIPREDRKMDVVQTIQIKRKEKGTYRGYIAISSGKSEDTLYIFQLFSPAVSLLVTPRYLQLRPNISDLRGGFAFVMDQVGFFVSGLEFKNEENLSITQQHTTARNRSRNDRARNESISR